MVLALTIAIPRGTPVCTENLIRIDCVTESPNVNGNDRALLPGPAVSMVSIGAQGHHYHPTGDPGALASGRLSPLLALEIPLLWRPTANRRGPARADPADER